MSIIICKTLYRVISHRPEKYLSLMRFVDPDAHETASMSISCSNSSRSPLLLIPQLQSIRIRKVILL